MASENKEFIYSQGKKLTCWQLCKSVNVQDFEEWLILCSTGWVLYFVTLLCTLWCGKVDNRCPWCCCVGVMEEFFAGINICLVILLAHCESNIYCNFFFIISSTEILVSFITFLSLKLSLNYSGPQSYENIKWCESSIIKSQYWGNWLFLRGCRGLVVMSLEQWKWGARARWTEQWWRQLT